MENIVPCNQAKTILAWRKTPKHKKWIRTVDKYKNKCRVCNSTEKLETHHLIPIKNIADAIYRKLKPGQNFLDALCNSDKMHDFDNAGVYCKKCHLAKHRSLKAQPSFLKRLLAERQEKICQKP